MARIFTMCLVFVGLCAAADAAASPLSKWRTSCGVDTGALERSGKNYVFRTSTNRCPGGIFNQRSEIATEKIKPTHKAAYRFRTSLSMTTPSKERFTVFQIHDGRMGCAPPLSVVVERNGQLALISDLKTGPGESCVRGKLSEQRSTAKLSREGRETLFEVILDFDGEGNFDVYLFLDGALQISGRYETPDEDRYFKSAFFYLKHGVYSQNMFAYEMRSSDLQVKRVKLER